MMSEVAYRNEILAYFSRPLPDDPLELARTVGDIKAVSQVLVILCEKLNQPRTNVKLLQQEISLLKTAVGKLEEAIEQAGVLNEEHRQLTQQRDALLTKQELINDLGSQRAEIAQLTAFVAQHNIPRMQQQLLQLQQDATGDISTLNTWLKEAGNFFTQLYSEFTGETRNLFRELELKKEQVDACLTAAGTQLHNHQVHLSSRLQAYQEDLDKLYAGYQASLAHLDSVKQRLQEAGNQHDKNIAVYEKHLAHNREIYGELGKVHHLDEHLGRLTDGIEIKLREFDKEIRTLVEKADHLSAL